MSTAVVWVIVPSHKRCGKATDAVDREQKALPCMEHRQHISWVPYLRGGDVRCGAGRASSHTTFPPSTMTGSSVSWSPSRDTDGIVIIMMMPLPTTFNNKRCDKDVG